MADLVGYNSNTNENKLKYLSEFIESTGPELNPKASMDGSQSFLSNDTELEQSHIQKYAFKGGSGFGGGGEVAPLDERSKLLDIEPKPIVNLPRLDDMISFEEYQYLNNLKGIHVLKHGQFYGEAKQEEASKASTSKATKSYINASEFNPYYKTAMSQFSSMHAPNQATSSPGLKTSTDTTQAIAASPHKALRNINFATRRQPRVIYKSRDRPPPPKLVRLNNSKKADPESHGSVEIQVRSTRFYFITCVGSEIRP